MKVLIIILVGLFVSWHYTDLNSSSVLHSIVLPIVMFIFSVALLIWLISKAGLSGTGNSSDGFIDTNNFDDFDSLD